MAKVLLILAGYTGVGKTTLLATALRQQVPLFGRKHDALFQATRIPPRLPETRRAVSPACGKSPGWDFFAPAVSSYHTGPPADSPKIYSARAIGDDRLPSLQSGGASFT